MKLFATLADADRKILLDEAAARSNISTQILEKDFWVCWTLARLFDDPGLEDKLLFKGGTSLSKVFRVIDRFSEDVDLGVRPAVLGFQEADLIEAPSKTQRLRRHAALQSACCDFVRLQMLPRLESVFRECLGDAPRANWLEYGLHEPTGSPELRFRYPSISSDDNQYIAKAVKLEFGSLTSQQPLSKQPVIAMVGELLDLDHQDLHARVTVLDAGRTFWEKATILHAEFHRPVTKNMPDRYARHYSDFAALWQHDIGRTAATDLAMLADVVRHKSQFFASARADYATAKRGSMRLSPPDARIPELRRDFEKMRPMFLGTPPDFAAVLAAIAEAERSINSP